MAKKPIRYIRFWGRSTFTNTDHIMYFSELEAWNTGGTNILRGMKPKNLLTLSNLSDSALGITNSVRATDGDTSNFTILNKARFLQYDLGEVREDLDEIFMYIYPTLDYEEIKIEVSQDNEVWEALYNSGITTVVTPKTNSKGKYFLATVPDQEQAPEVIPDTNSPVFGGLTNVSVEVGAEFNPMAGVMALDDIDNNITDRIQFLSTVDTNKVGNYTVFYTVSDSSGNTATGQRQVNVYTTEVATPPTMTTLNAVQIEVGNTFSPLLGIEAFDFKGVDISDRIEVLGEVDTNRVGVYKIFYLVADDYGFSITKERTIEVYSNVVVEPDAPPVILGIEPLVIAPEEEVDLLAGVQAIDYAGNDITEKVNLIDSTLKVQSVGSYNVFYVVSDNTGSLTTAPRQVMVVANKEEIASLELQKSLFNSLSVNADYPVYEIVPQGASFPYITIGEEVLVDNLTKDSDRTTHNVTFHTWSQGTSSLESKELNAYVKSRALSQLSINGFELDMSELEMIRTLREENNIFHGVVQVEITLTRKEETNNG